MEENFRCTRQGCSGTVTLDMVGELNRSAEHQHPIENLAKQTQKI